MNNIAEIQDLPVDNVKDLWGEPVELINKIKPEDYPIDCLPPILRDAVVDVQDFVQAPISLVACSAMSSLSLAVQGYINVKRAAHLIGPVSLYFLTIAEPNERKSTVDDIFVKVIKEYQDSIKVKLEPELTKYQADFAAWEAEKRGVGDAIRKLSKQGGKPKTNKELTMDELKSKLRQLEINQPQRPRVPRVKYEDSTPEVLTYNLATKWPCVAVLSSEGGKIFGSHGMKQESIINSLSTYNKLWGGEDIITDRRTSESFEVRGARVTVGIQVQEAPFTDFLQKAGHSARGTGFLARFLFSQPKSTQGYRPFKEPPEHVPSLELFNERITTLLENKLPINEKGELEPAIIELSPEAKDVWVTYHDHCEKELREGNELSNINDVAGKVAENAARIAALFHVLEHGFVGQISKDSMESACSITSWHIIEAAKFYGEMSQPIEQLNASKLDSWLIRMCLKQGSGFERDTISMRHIQQYVTPVRLRNDKQALDNAITSLIELGRIKRFDEGRKKLIQINPALIK